MEQRSMVRDHKWTLTALVAIGGALLLTRGGVASLAPLMRFCLPFGVAYFTYRLVRAKVREMTGYDQRRPVNKDARGEGTVIDLCPKCGSYLQPGHRCKV